MQAVRFVGWGCGRCHACQLSMENYCENWASIGSFSGGHPDFHQGSTPYGCSVSIPYRGSRVELTEVIAMAQDGRTTRRPQSSRWSRRSKFTASSRPGRSRVAPC